ncbi:hypothetical protein KM043_018639 [Ampulex compressa]|nr:hypothetical protein KM043_018639 [Ampulex compressa]
MGEPSRATHPPGCPEKGQVDAEGSEERRSELVKPQFRFGATASRKLVSSTPASTRDIKLEERANLSTRISAAQSPGLCAASAGREILTLRSGGCS